jgi:hypothetical protein
MDQIVDSLCAMLDARAYLNLEDTRLLASLRKWQRTKAFLRMNGRGAAPSDRDVALCGDTEPAGGSRDPSPRRDTAQGHNPPQRASKAQETGIGEDDIPF